MTSRPPVTRDAWHALRAHTPARLALGRAGASLPTSELLRFTAAHALARDAVHVPLDVDALEAALRADDWITLRAASAAPDRATYLLRPDLGRALAQASQAALLAAAPPPHDLLIVVADGLSSTAAASHAAPLLAALRALVPEGVKLGPVVLATQARVALGDEIAEAAGAPMVAMVIGERPGLSSPDSLSIYLTHAPRRGRRDAERNCISNIRPQGQPFDIAARRFWWLCQEARRLQVTGVALKDMSDAPVLANDAP